MSELQLNLLVQIPNALGLAGTQLAGKKKRIGWLVAVLAEVAWVAWAIPAHAYGVLPWCALWGVGYAANWWRWRK